MRIHRAIVGAAFVWAVAAFSGGAYAFEFTSVGGTDADGSAHYQDPDEKGLPSQLGGLQFGTTGSGISQNSDADSGVPPWRIQPPAPSAGFTGSAFGAPSIPR